MKTPHVLLIAVLATAASQCFGQIQTSGTILVNLDASTQPLGPLSLIPNTGTAGGNFVTNGLNTPNYPMNSITNFMPNVVATPGGAKAISFDGSQLLQLQSTNTAFGGTNMPTPTALLGVNPTFSIEAWVLSPGVFAESTIASWGARASSTALNTISNVAFCIGSSASGAVDYNFGNANLWWGSVPSANVWHHLVMTYDGSITRVYSDGQMANSITNPAGVNLVPYALDPTAPATNSNPITIGAQRSTSATGFTAIGNDSIRGHYLLSKVRIHTGVLSLSQITNNYLVELPAYTFAPTPLTAGPIHRWMFNADPNNVLNDLEPNPDASMVGVPDAVGGYYGTIISTSGTGSAQTDGHKLWMQGGNLANAPYVDLPNNMISVLSASNGGSGQVTLEGWCDLEGNQTWANIFSFGATATDNNRNYGHPGSELQTQGGTGSGVNYWTFQMNNTSMQTTRMDIHNNGFQWTNNLGSFNTNGVGTDIVGTGGNATERDAGVNFFNIPLAMTHYAMSWNEASGEVVLYINGQFVWRVYTPLAFIDLNDVNCWLGRSQWGDLNLDANYDEFRIYDHVLSPGEVFNDYIAGPDNVVTNSLGTATALHLTIPHTNSLMVGSFQQVSVTADYGNVSNVMVLPGMGVTFSSSDPTIATITPSGYLRAVAAGSVTITATFGALTSSVTQSVIPLGATLVHRYSFNTDGVANDSVGTADGTLMGTATVSGGKLRMDGSIGQTSLGGVGNYLALPPGIINGTNYDAVTIEAWIDFNNTTANNFVWGFGDMNWGMGNGNNGGHYIFMSTAPNTRIAITDIDSNNGNNEKNAQLNGSQAGNANVHLVAVYDPMLAQEKLYRNGFLVAQNLQAILPLTVVSNRAAFIGRSLFGADPYFNGNFDELRIWSGELTPGQIAINDSTGPNVITNSPGTLTNMVLVVTNSLPAGFSQQLYLRGDFTTVKNINLFTYGQPFGISVDNTNIITVTSNGVLTAKGVGTANVTATYGSFTSTAAITVYTLVANLTHRYGFTNDANDSIGGAAYNGTLQGDATLSGGQVQLGASGGGYVQFPGNSLSNYFAVSFEAWASIGENTAASTTAAPWLFGYGDVNTANSPITGRYYLYLAPDSTRVARFGVNSSDGGTANDVNASLNNELDLLTNIHVVAVYNPLGSYETVYVNGQLLASNAVTVQLGSLRDTTEYLGKSLYNAAAAFNGSIDEFRIYNGPLSPSQIAIDAATGPNSIVGSTNALGTLTSITPVWPTNLLAANSPNASAFLQANFAGAANPLNLVTYTTNKVTFSSSDTNVVTVTPQGIIAVVGAGNAVITANFNGVNYTQSFTVIGGPRVNLQHRWSFNDGTANDSVGGVNGVLMGSATVTNNALRLDGTTGSYLSLGSGLLQNLTNATFEVWVTPASIATWARIFDFGNNSGGREVVSTDTNGVVSTNIVNDGYGTNGTGTTYAFLATSAGTNPRFAVTTNSSGAESPIDNGTSAMVAGTKYYVAVVYDNSNNVSRYYLNGAQQSTGVAAIPLTSIVDTNDYVGRSQWADPYLNGTIDELRIWNGVLSASEIGVANTLGPNVLPVPSLSISKSTNAVPTVTAAWPSWAAKYSVQTTTNLQNGSWVNIPFSPTLSGTTLNVTIPAPGQSGVYYRLSY